LLYVAKRAPKATLALLLPSREGGLRPQRVHETALDLFEFYGQVGLPWVAWRVAARVIQIELKHGVHRSISDRRTAQAWQKVSVPLRINDVARRRAKHSFPPDTITTHMNNAHALGCGYPRSAILLSPVPSAPGRSEMPLALPHRTSHGRTTTALADGQGGQKSKRCSTWH
jgi:hypothetical protein